MKKIILAAAGLVALTATQASAQHAPYHRDHHPYAKHNHHVCQDKARRLHDFERRAARDGHIDRRERSIIDALRRDLGRTCGGFRWHG